jgi:thiol-disulfide isomerase/thioredoxin
MTEGPPETGPTRSAGPDGARPSDGPGAGAHEPLAPPDPAAASRRPATSLLTWGTAALVLVVVIGLIVIKLTGTQGPSTTPSAAVTPAPAAPTVAAAVTAIPESVYDSVGVASSDAALTPPSVLHGQPRLIVGGKPLVVFVGNEFCPYCAAERWAVVAALSRFGTFGDTLYASQSGSNEVFSGTPTFTFDGTRYRSKYLSATLVEHYGDQKNGAGTAYAVLEPLTAEERSLLAKYDRRTPGAPGGLVPFVDVANEAVVSGGQFSPSVLQDLNVNQIATGLTDPDDPATQAIVASANYLSAAICHADGGMPARVCTSAGVADAASALGLRP